MVKVSCQWAFFSAFFFPEPIRPPHFAPRNSIRIRSMITLQDIHFSLYHQTKPTKPLPMLTLLPAERTHANHISNQLCITLFFFFFFFCREALKLQLTEPTLVTKRKKRRWTFFFFHTPPIKKIMKLPFFSFFFGQIFFFFVRVFFFFRVYFFTRVLVLVQTQFLFFVWSFFFY